VVLVVHLPKTLIYQGKTAYHVRSGTWYRLPRPRSPDPPFEQASTGIGRCTTTRGTPRRCVLPCSGASGPHGPDGSDRDGSGVLVDRASEWFRV